MNYFLTKTKLPTAIFSSNDILALATLQVANEKGIKVPESLSIVGMDGIFSGEVSYPPLTTVQKIAEKQAAVPHSHLLKK